MEETILKLKSEIIEALNLDLRPAEIDEDAPIFGEGLELDSIDALELIVLLDKNYGLKVRDEAHAKELFVSVRTLATFIHENKK